MYSGHAIEGSDEYSHITHVLSTTNTSEDFSALVQEVRQAYLLANVVYHPAFVPGLVQKQLFLTYDRAWVDEYLKHDYFRIDPVEAAARQAVVPIDWTNVDHSSSSEVRAFFEEADRYGVGRQGVSMPVRHPNGAYGVFTVTSNASDREWSEEKRTKVPELHLLATHIHQHFVAVAYKSSLSMINLSLTPRERDALTLLASGHEIKQIADQFGRSQTTIRNDLRIASLKLGCANPYRAATKAIVHGLVDIRDLDLH